ncbi:MAG: PRC-barrel domain-containing protein [Pseudooceanicola sp.]|nr:PRC-barrel domain-containing protein [Pseudooceanicola sp.]
MKNLMLSTAMMALAGTAYAAEGEMFRPSADPMEIHASDFIGKRVYASEAQLDAENYNGVQEGWEDIGEINDVILSRDGSVDAVLVDIGGFLGIGERQVAVDMSAIKFVADDATAEDLGDYFLVMNASRANFEEAPEYSWEKTEATMETKAAEAEAKIEKGAEKTAEAVDNAADKTAAAIDKAADKTEAAVDKAADKTEAAVDKAATKTEVAVNDAVTDPAAKTERQPVQYDGYAAAKTEELTAEMLTGAPAYDANNEWIGEVSELILSEQGQITSGVVDVGGFLGIGEKPVQLSMDDLEILRETDGDDVRVYISMTKEELEALPTFDK